MQTQFAPAERAPLEEVHADRRYLLAREVIRALLDTFPEPVVILNRYRQVVLANDAMIKLVGVPEDEFIGKRPGEAVECIHCRDNTGGCGTGIFCRHCGAVNAVLRCQMHNRVETEECRITVNRDGKERSLDIRVRVTPFELENVYAVCTLQDISQQKRKEVLERTFREDLLGLAGDLRESVQDLPQEFPHQSWAERQRAAALADQIVGEMEMARDLAAAEAGELVVRIARLDARQLLSSVTEEFRDHRAAEGKSITPLIRADDSSLRSDAALLKVVLAQLLKNALEATPAGGSVRMEYRRNPQPVFEIHNSSVMPEEVSMQVFQRSFSTKDSPGHGVGAYLAKLITEQYLGGKVHFVSRIDRGTTFSLSLPLDNLREM